MIFARLERHRLAVDARPASASVPVSVPSAPAPVAAADRLKMSTVLDQHDDTSFEVLTDKKRAELRQNHQTMCGGPAPDGARPSSEQLGAMLSRLGKGKSPYADFSVFQPHGGRLAMHHKFDAQIFVGGELTTRHLKGPINFAAWKACWAVFRATMISLVEISPATLDAYERGIGQLVTLFPQHWGIIFCGDALTRSERWNEIAEGLKDSGSWPEDRPWDMVMKLTTYGGEESTIAQQHWWSHRVVFFHRPCGFGPTAAQQQQQQQEQDQEQAQVQEQPPCRPHPLSSSRAAQRQRQGEGRQGQGPRWQGQGRQSPHQVMGSAGDGGLGPLRRPQRAPVRPGVFDQEATAWSYRSRV